MTLSGWLGQFHVVIVHFPIALLLVAAGLEIGNALRGDNLFQTAVRANLWIGVGFAVLAALTGWLQAGTMGVEPGLKSALFWHRWLGIASALWFAGLIVLERKRWPLFRPAIWLGAPLIALTGHFGGTLVHGTDYIQWWARL
jgi:uncharacterized membrane protein